jgi:hypothetical protein
MSVDNPNCDASECEGDTKDVDSHIIGKRGNMDADDRRH